MKHRSFEKPKSSTYMQRAVDVFLKRQKFLIVCEGEKTEPNYFKCFRIPGIVVKVQGFGYNTVRLVEKAIELKLKEIDRFDQVWCVFDKDDFSVQNFNRAIELAERNAIQVAYSNEAFELWYLLHFNYYNTGITRQDYCKLLDDLLGHEYEKNSTSIYDEIFAIQSIAIMNAENLLRTYRPNRPSEDNPSTTVHLLVKEINRFSR